MARLPGLTLAACALAAQLAAASALAQTAPAVYFTDVQVGPNSGGPGGNGVPISIFGKRFGASQGSSTVTIGGVPVAAVVLWGSGNAHNPDLDEIVVQPGAAVTGGAVVVTVGGQASNVDQTFTANAGNLYFVAPGGSDQNGCGLAAPCATVSYAAQTVAQPGDTVLVRGGTYSGDNVWIRAGSGNPNEGGIAGSPKTIKNYPGEEVTELQLGDNFLIDADFVTVAGLHFPDGASLTITGWVTPRQQGCRLIDNTFGGNIAYAAVSTEGDNHLIAGNVCDLTGSSQGTEGHCYYIAQGSGNQIVHNVGAGAPGYQIHLHDEVRATPDTQRLITNVLVDGNLLASSPQRSGLILDMDDTCAVGTACVNGVCAGTSTACYGNAMSNITIENNLFVANNFAGLQVNGILSGGLGIYNNTFYQNGEQGLDINADTNISGVDIRNNLIYQDVNTNCLANCAWFTPCHIQQGAGAQNVTLDHNFYYPGPANILGGSDANAVTGAVSFADAPSLDFHLLAGSAPIDSGLTLAAVPLDHDALPRPQGSAYCVGAFEYVASAGAGNGGGAAAGSTAGNSSAGGSTTGHSSGGGSTSGGSAPTASSSAGTSGHATAGGATSNGGAGAAGGASGAKGSVSSGGAAAGSSSGVSPSGAAGGCGCDAGADAARGWPWWLGLWPLRRRLRSAGLRSRSNQRGG